MAATERVPIEDVREYFFEVTCNLRVLGSQLGLEPYELDNLTHHNKIDREELLEECFKKEKITSWQEFVNVLEKPSLGQHKITKEITERYLSREETLTSMSPIQSPSLSTASHSDMETTNTGKIELRDAVNEIMRIPCVDLHQLGSSLELDNVRMQDILSLYGVEEQHQRVMELWFRTEGNPTWEKLYASMPRRDSLTGSTRSSFSIQRELSASESMQSASPTPISPDQKSDMFRSNEVAINSHFGYLLTDVRSVLEFNHVKVDDVRQVLIAIFHREDCLPQTNLKDLFNAVTVNKLWSSEHYHPLEELIERFIPDHRSMMAKYKGHVSGFHTTTKLIEYMANKNIPCDDTESAPSEFKSSLPIYRTLKVRLKLDRRISDVTMDYVHRLWVSFAEEYDIPSLTAVIDKILEGSLEIVWLVLPHIAEMIAASAHKSLPFLQRHSITYLAIDDDVIYDSSLLGNPFPNLNTEVSMEYSTNDSKMIKATSHPTGPVDTPSHTNELESGSEIRLSVSSQLKHTEQQVTEFRAKFSELHSKTRQELITLNRSVDVVNAKLRRALPARLEKDYYRFVKSKRGGKQSSIEEFFDDISDYCWNCFEYELLQFVILSNNCHTALKNEIEEYGRDVQHFQYCTSASAFIQHGQKLLKKKSLARGYRKLKVKHAICSKEYTLANINGFREDIWKADPSLSECSLHYHVIAEGSLEVVWAFHEEFSYPLIAFFCSEAGSELMQQYHINEIFIDDIPINSSLYLIEAATLEKWTDADSILQDKATELDLNYSHQSINGWTALFHMAAKGMVDLVQKMLALGANPNIRDINGQTPLMIAVEAGHLHVVKVFLTESTPQCDLNVQDKVHGRSVLHIAAEKGFTDIFEILSDPTYGIDKTLKDKNGRTALEIAEEKENSSSQVTTELTPTPRTGWFGRLRDRWESNRRETRLTRAVINGSVADVQKALDAGANPNRIINRVTRRTPILEASQRGHTEVVRLLLSRGADPNWRAAEDWNALVLASRNGHVETVELLLSWTPSCRELVNVNAGYYQWTPLHTTCYYASYELAFKTSKEDFLERLKRVTELLLDNGADATITDKNGETPLTYASDKGYAELAKVIIEKTLPEKRKALIDYQKKDSLSALLLASKQGHANIVKNLLEEGASLTVTNKSKMTALHLGVSGGHIDVVEELASNADSSAINAVDKHGLTPLILATKLKNIKLVEVLHKHGADVNAQTHEKKTALLYAARLNSIALVNLLTQYGADLFATDSNQQSAKTLATDKQVQKRLRELERERLDLQQQLRDETTV